jgi:hypothetical protein
MSALKWTDKKPTKPGFYFWRYNSKCGHFVAEVIAVKDKSLALWFCGGDAGSGEVKEIPGQWAGPIKEPK